MKFIYRLEDLDCAHCASKMESVISKIEGVKSAQISFLAQKLTLEADENKIDEIMKKAVSLCKKIEPDCDIILR